MAKRTELADRNKIYAVKWPGEKRANGIALYVDPDYRGFEGICYLTPGERGHMIEGKLGKRTRDGFTFVSKGYAPGTWEFIEVTYENFKQEYHRLVEASEELLPQVSSTEELQDWYHRNFPM